MEQKELKPTDDNKKSIWVIAGEYSSLGFILPTSVLAGYFIGWWLDKKFGTNYLYLVFLILGIIAGFIQIFRFLKKHEDGRRRGRPQSLPDYGGGRRRRNSGRLDAVGRTRSARLHARLGDLVGTPGGPTGLPCPSARGEKSRGAHRSSRYSVICLMLAIAVCYPGYSETSASSLLLRAVSFI